MTTTHMTNPDHTCIDPFDSSHTDSDREDYWASLLAYTEKYITQHS